MTEVKKVSLYNISEQINLINLEIQNSNGEITDEMESVMESLSNELMNKTDGVTDFIKSEKNRILEIDLRIKELAEFKKVKANALSRFNEYIVRCMSVIDQKKINGTLSSISIRNNPKTLKIVDENKIPIDYIEVIKTKKILNTEIKNALKNGELIEGAILIDGTKSLTLK